ncbi:MAG: nitric oxide dioxygenase [Caballeronia sp.]|nr:nitric oxide dioxygenase [Caballeronia sp.]
MTVLTADQIARVKATAPVLAEHGATITTHFYKRLFINHPELKNVFNQAHQQSASQPQALARAVYAYAANIDNLGALGSAVTHIAHKHASLNIRPEQYPIVGENLLAAVSEVLGDAIDEPTLDAWRAAYAQLAEIFIGAEKQLYAQAAWSGFRPFVVFRREQESDEITSFYLKPSDGGPVCHFEPGQYISVKRFVKEIGVVQPRQYTLSDAPNGEWLRISVKREKPQDTPAGYVSNLMHDGMEVGGIVEVSAPMGEFTLDRNKTTPVVLISGGVGITPMVSMLASLTAQNSTRQISFVHACRNGRTHAFGRWLDTIVAKHPNVSRTVFYENTHADDRPGTDFDFTGRLDFARIADKTVLPDADYYLCGPVPFMRAQQDALTAAGVSKARVRTEVYGSGEMA